MGDNSGIEWTDATWNPIAGCSRVSPGCDRCYAERQTATRLKNVPAYAGLAGPDGRWTGEIRLLPERLDQPLRWRRPRRIFVNSMSDLFHEDVPDRFIAQVFDVMARASHHQFQILTKRPQRMARWVSRVARCEHGWLTHDGTNPAGSYDGTGEVISGEHGWPLPNVWLGTSIESQQYAFRARHLLNTPAAIRFISAEPLLGSLDLTEYLTHSITNGRLLGVTSAGRPAMENVQRRVELDWLIVGGESGPGARPMHPKWARSLRDQCQEAGVPFLFKQFGEFRPTDLRPGHVLEQRGGPDISEMYWHIRRPAGYRPLAVVEPEWACGLHYEGNVVMERVGKHEAGRTLDGRTWDEYPERSTT